MSLSPSVSRAARLLVALSAGFIACTSDHHPSSFDVATIDSGAGNSTGQTSSTLVDAGARSCDAGTTASGDCVLTCLATEVQCGASCSDLTADTGNCGGCGAACGSLQEFAG